MQKGADGHAMRGAALAALLAIGLAAQADVRTLYRWTDAQGRIQYSDKPPPASFKGEVTRMDVDTEMNTRESQSTPSPRVAPEVLKDVTPDRAQDLRGKRAKLLEARRAAEKKVADAKAALAQGGEPKDDELGIVQRHYAKSQPDKGNCRAVTEGGKKTFMCPGMAPNEQYYERQRGLEDALKQAEEELAQAELAYRRGID